MKQVLYILLISFLSNTLANAQDEADVLQYIEKYKKLAMQEQVRSGVPAAITLAQGIHESACGKSELATLANNHFGIKCKNTWKGATILHDDDAKQECFRKYASSEDSYLDHSNFLRQSNRYAFLFDLDITDYKGWASGLKRAGYATNPLYVKRLTDLIEKYNLQQYTYEAQKASFQTPKAEVVPDNDSAPPSNTLNSEANTPFETMQNDETNGIETYKGLKGFWAKKGDRLDEYAQKYNVRYAKLLGMNELEDEPLPYDMFLFLERKRKTGTEEFHIVKPNETIHLIAQKEAILLENLLYYNNLNKGEEPEVGERLTLQYKAYDKPKLKPKLSDIPVKGTMVETKNANEVNINEQEPSKATREEEELALRRAQQAAEEEARRIDEQKAIEAAEEEARRMAQVAAEEEARKEREAKRNEAALKTESSVIPAAKNSSESNIPPASEPEPGKEQAILDMEKAKRTAALLGGDIKDATLVPTEPVLEKSIPIQNELNTPSVTKPEKNTAPPKSMELPDFIKNRKYDEPTIDDSLKMLKKKFDQIVYKPIPERKKLEPKSETPKAEVKPVTQKTTSNAPKAPEPKPESPKTEAKPLTQKNAKSPAKTIEPKKEESGKKVSEQKNTDVVKTATGVKKQNTSSAKKDADAKKQESKASAKEEKSKKEDDKKNKKTDVKNKGQRSEVNPKEKASKPKSDAKSANNKNTDKKKK